MNEKTVWILGSGFSKPLGGPLLRDLFRHVEWQQDLIEYFPPGDYPELAFTTPWVQLCFRNGADEGLWDNAEQFLAYVDDAYHGDTTRHGILTNLIDRSGHITRVGATGKVIESRPVALTKSMKASFNLQTKRALAAQCSRFLPSDKSEMWYPYADWMKSLRPEMDTVISFNYDVVVETARRGAKGGHPLWTGLPDDPMLAGHVPLLKLHGSIDWKILSNPGVKRIVLDADVLRVPGVDIAIASPGGTKPELAFGAFQPLWAIAEDALAQASRLVVIGYSFPDTDPTVQTRLLGAFSRRNSQMRTAHLILGDDQTLAMRRLVSLIRSTANGDRVYIHDSTESITAVGPRLQVVRHPLGTQDFIGRHQQFTESGW